MNKFNKKVKGIISLFCVLMLSLSSVVVFAEDAVQSSADAYVSYEEEKIYVSYNCDIPYVTDVMFYLVGEGEDFASVQKSLRVGSCVYTPGETAQAVILAGDDITDGRYVIYAIPGGYLSEEYAVYSPSFRYMDSASRTIALGMINNASKENIADVFISNLSEVFGIEDANVSPLAGVYMEKIRQDDFGGSFPDIEKVYEAYLLADVLYDINNPSEIEPAELIENNNELLGVDIETKYYISFEQEVLRLLKLASDRTELMSKKTFSDAFCTACAVAAVNKSDISLLDDIFTENSAALGISAYMTDYKKVSKTSFARQFDGFSADSAQEVAQKFVSVLNKLEESDSSGTSSGGGGGGGKKTTGGGTIGINPVSNSLATTEKKAFSDTDSHWAGAYISALADMNIINGYSDGSFRPEAPVTREEFAKIIVCAFALEHTGETAEGFLDIPKDFWAYEYVKAASSLGIVKGTGNGLFGKGENISRQDAAVMLERIIKLKAITTEGAYDVHFTDKSAVASYAEDAVTMLSNAGIINGFSDGSFAPEKSITRAEASKIIYSVLCAN